MKPIRSAGEKFRFEMDPSEKALLFHVLQLYPLVPADHHRLSKDRYLANCEENQHLLEESLLARRLENRKQVDTLLNEPGRFKECPGGFRAGFTRGELEWLLQVLNDVRVGGWLALGSPDEHPEKKEGMSRQTLSHIMTMDVAGFFEMNFLNAVMGDPHRDDD